MSEMSLGIGKPGYRAKQVVVHDESGRMLYAGIVIASILVGGQWVLKESRPLPVFAFDQDEARRELNSRLTRMGVRAYTEVAVAPAVGMFCHDDNGDKCSFSPRDRRGRTARVLRPA